MITCRGATKGGWRVLKHPQPKKVYPVIRPDPMTFLLGGPGYLHLHFYEYFRYFITALSNSPVSDYSIPACLYFKIHRQLTIVEVPSDGNPLMSVADIHVNWG